ncbi:hypothetical protein [Dongia sp.]|uniref:hypothetical protein n=1 Tax=Dongia sp. TaxID=1977262 RepID=UPI0035B33484
MKSFLWTGGTDGAKLAPPPLGPNRDELGQNDMSASAKDLPGADLGKTIRDKHYQAEDTRHHMGLGAEPGLNSHRMTDDPPFRRPERHGSTEMGPTLSVDPADRVYATGGEARGQGRFGMVIIALIGAAVIGGIFLWSQRGSEEASVVPSPMPTTSSTTNPADVTAANATTTSPTTPPATTAAPATATPTQAPTTAPAATTTAAPVVEEKAATPPAPPAPAVAAPAETSAPAATEKATTEKAATQKAATEKTVEKPKTAAPAAATTEKKKKKAAETTKATTKPKPAAESSDENFSTLLKSLTSEDAAAPAPSEPAVQQPAATQPTNTTKSSAPLPSSTAPSTPGSQLFTQ